MNRSVESIMTEDRVFSPSEAFKKQANVRSPKCYEEGEDTEAFWEEQSKRLEWIRPFDKLVNFDPPKIEWYIGGKLNASVNCLDRHLKGPRKNKAAFIWEGENGETKTLTYWELYRDVCRFSNVLRSLGVKKGDRLAIYMPLVPEAVIAMLASARIGAVHTVVFGGFSAESLADRINDCDAKLLITADGGYRRGAVIPLKMTADKALERTPGVKDVIVLKRTGVEIDWKKGRDHDYNELMKGASYEAEPEVMDSEDPLFILYTSGTTGKPKGIYHTTAGYLVGAATTTDMVFDLKEEDVYWCTADVGWITGHTYVVYGPMLNGATQVIYEGAPDWPKKDRFWKIIERYGVSVFYTAPTAIRAFMKWGENWPKYCDLSSLRLLGTVGEPINPEAWLWYYTHIGQSRCPIVDTWWQTETGSIMISPLPGIVDMRPGSATKPLPGVKAEILNDQGHLADTGYLVLSAPWPSMTRGVWGDPERFFEVYWSKFPGKYFTGDGAKLENGYYWLLGRVDDVMNISGHRLGTMEIESSIVAHPEVAEAAVVGVKDALKGETPVAFVTLKEGIKATNDKEADLKSYVVEKIGAIARPSRIIFTKDLPKTRSGKIMRRLLKDIAEGRVIGDVTTLADQDIVEELKAKYNED